MTQEDTEKSGARLGVCFLHPRDSARLRPCWGLPQVWRGHELLLPWLEFMRSVPTSNSESHWLDWKWSMDVKAWGHGFWISISSVTLLCCGEAFWGEAFQGAYCPWASASLIALMTSWPMDWAVRALCWLARLPSELHAEGLEGNREYTLADPFFPTKRMR